MTTHHPITPEELKDLEAELHRLKSKDLQEITNAIALAKAKGDLSENAEYTTALEKQGFINGRIAMLENIKNSAQIIDPITMSGDVIKFGATVDLIDEDTGQMHRYQIIGSYGAKIETDTISLHSPLAKALIGKKKGDFIEVEAPTRVRSYEILNVRYV